MIKLPKQTEESGYFLEGGYLFLTIHLSVVEKELHNFTTTRKKRENEGREKEWNFNKYVLDIYIFRSIYNITYS